MQDAYPIFQARFLLDSMRVVADASPGLSQRHWRQHWRINLLLLLLLLLLLR